MEGEGTKDVSQAQERTDMDNSDTLLAVNGITKEVQRVPVNVLAEKIGPQSSVAPAYYDDYFGL